MNLEPILKNLALPEDIKREFEQLYTAIQAWSNQYGRWTDAIMQGADFTVDGVTNSWAVKRSSAGNKTSQLSYLIIGNAMWVNLDVRDSVLTIGAGVSVIYVRVPDGYRIAGTPAALGGTARTHRGAVQMSLAGTLTDGYVTAAPDDKDYLAIRKADGTNFATANPLIVTGQVFFEVETRDINSTIAL